MTINPRQLSFFALTLVVVSAILTGVIVYRDRIWRAVSTTPTIEVAIASTPSGAEVYIDGTLVGKTPLKLPVKQGQRTVELRKRGYEDTSKAFYVSYMPTKWQDVQRELNIDMKPTALAASLVARHSVVQPITAPSKDPAPGRDPLVTKELRELRSMILANPNESVTVTALQERVRLQSDEIKSLRDDVREVKEQSKWFIGALVTVLLGVLAAVVAVLQAVPRKER